MMLSEPIIPIVGLDKTLKHQRIVLSGSVLVPANEVLPATSHIRIQVPKDLSKKVKTDLPMLPLFLHLFMQFIQDPAASVVLCMARVNARRKLNAPGVALKAIRRTSVSKKNGRAKVLFTDTNDDGVYVSANLFICAAFLPHFCRKSLYEILKRIHRLAFATPLSQHLHF